MDDLAAQLDELRHRSRSLGVAELLNDIGAAEAMCGCPEAALVHLSSARLLDPHNEDVRDNLGALVGSPAMLDGIAAVLNPTTAARKVEAHGVPLPDVAEVTWAGGPSDHEHRSAVAGAWPVTPWSATGGPTAAPAAQLRDDPAPERFAGHYYEWRRKRVRAIVQRYGGGWFKGARVLELGCGYGDIGVALQVLGADVTFSEGRREHLDVIADRYPGLSAERLVAYDAEHPWPFTERFDLVINMGLVYHVDTWERSIIGSLRSAPRVVLETEVCDSDDPSLVLKNPEEGPDQAVSGIGSRPSAPAVEALLRAEGFRFERVDDNRCNAGFHRYDWPVRNTGGWEHGLRRFWFAWREGTQPT